MNGQSAFCTYNIASRKTTVKNTIDNADKTENVTTVYTFDNDGTLCGSYAYVNGEDKVQVTPSGSGINAYASGIHYVVSGSNLLTNHRFTGTSGWTPISGVCSSFTRSVVTNQATAPYGKTMLSLVSSSGQATGDGVYQLTSMLAAGEYTFSTYLKLLSNTSGSVNNTGVFLRVTDTGDHILAESERLTNADRTFIRLILPFTLKTSQSVKAASEENTIQPLITAFLEESTATGEHVKSSEHPVSEGQDFPILFVSLYPWMKETIM